METERVKIRRFFIWKFTLTSFAFGIFIGLILTFILIIASSLGLGQIDILGKQFNILKSSFVTLFSIIILITFPLLFAFLGFLYSIFYNTLSRIGINLDLGLSPVEQNQPAQQVQQTAQTIQPAPVANQSSQPNQNQFY
jgi:hypothetical protein